VTTPLAQVSPQLDDGHVARRITTQYEAIDGRGRTSRARSVLAGVVLLLAFGCISALHDPRGSLGTDTGGKLATVQTMTQRGVLDPSIGYWAERADPTGSLHPLTYTSHLDGDWVNVTTLPMIVAAAPLAAIGGLRAVMLLPMLGGVLCAYAAAALAARLDRRARWPVFWIIGLATPVVIYATDFWEHSIGLGLLLVACVASFDLVWRRAGFATAVLAGACFGAAATMRTEALVYLVVAGLVVAATMCVERSGLRRVVSAGAGIAIGVMVVLAANQLLEHVVIGSGLRAARAAGTVGDAGSTLAFRAKEAVIATAGLNAFDFDRDMFAGALVVACVAVGALAVVQPRRATRLAGVAAFLVAALVYVVRIQHGVGFVPGLLVASPFAIVGLSTGWRHRRSRFVLAVACLPIPLIWASQYSGGALPQWGARYELLSGALLAVLGIVALVRVPQRTAFVCVLALAVGVSAFGIVFSVERSHDVASAMDVVVASGRPVIAREQHLLREGGAFYAPSTRWLTTGNDRELRRAVAVVAEAGDSEFELLQFHGRARIGELDGFEPVRVRVVEFVPGLLVDVIAYQRG